MDGLACGCECNSRYAYETPINEEIIQANMEVKWVEASDKGQALFYRSYAGYGSENRGGLTSPFFFFGGFKFSHTAILSVLV